MRMTLEIILLEYLGLSSVEEAREKYGPLKKQQENPVNG